MITPFTADGRVDYEALGRMIDYVIEGGADYIVALGTTAETPTLYIQERAVVAMFIEMCIRDSPYPRCGYRAPAVPIQRFSTLFSFV